MRYPICMLLVFSVQSFIVATAQNDDYKDPCSEGLDFKGLINFFKIKNATRMIDTLESACFEKFGEDFMPFSAYERRYQKHAGGDIVMYNEVFQLKDQLPLEYLCSDMAVFNSLLNEIMDNTIFMCDNLREQDGYLFLLKDKLHVAEMRNIEQPAIGYAYGFKYRNITAADLERLKQQKVKDSFPVNTAERARLEYRYARINSYNNITTINLKAGDKVYIKATGTITLGTFAGDGNPDGIDDYESYSIAQDFKHGSLLFRTGRSAWELAGKEKTFTVTKPGIVEFIVNDNDPSNNTGSFWIDLKIIRAH